MSDSATVSVRLAATHSWFSVLHLTWCLPRHVLPVVACNSATLRLSESSRWTWECYSLHTPVTFNPQHGVLNILSTWHTWNGWQSSAKHYGFIWPTPLEGRWAGKGDMRKWVKATAEQETLVGKWTCDSEVEADISGNANRSANGWGDEVILPCRFLEGWRNRKTLGRFDIGSLEGGKNRWTE